MSKNVIQDAQTKGPAFTLRTLNYASAAYPRKYAPKLPAEILRNIQPGWKVKVWIQAVGKSKKYDELVWGWVREVNKKKKNLVVQIGQMTDYAAFHGVLPRMHINVGFDYVINVAI